MNSGIEQQKTTFRKRRKRSRSAVKRQKVGDLQFLHSDKCKVQLDDSATKARNDDNDYAPPLLEKRSIRSLPILLAFRQSGQMRGSTRNWRTSALEQNNGNQVEKMGKQWRRYAAKQIPFSSLQTPLTEAILSLDRDGSYLISLDGGRASSTERPSEVPSPLLALKFYGVPSPQVLLQIQGLFTRSSQKKSRVVVSPLLQTVPLLLDHRGGSDENCNYSMPSSLFGGNDNTSFAVNTPVQILMSSDSVCGVGFLHHSTASSSGTGGPSLPTSSSMVETPAIRDEDSLGTILIFTLPGVSSSRPTLVQNSSIDNNPEIIPDKICSFKCSNVRVGWKAFTMRNLLWKTQFIPNSMDESNLGGRFCDSVRNVTGYVLFNDEDDGFRITWICHRAWNEDGGTVSILPLTNSSCQKPASRSDIVTPPEESVWDECWHDRFSGSTSEPGTEKQLDIIYEGYLRIDALLASVLETKNYFRRQAHPFTDFYYNLVSVGDQGRTAVFVIVFANGSSAKGPRSFGVVLRLDLFTQHYDEIEWVQHASRAVPSFLRHWCNKLALNQRLREQRIGPFCIGAHPDQQKSQNWPIPESEANFDPHEDANIDLEVWAKFVESANLTGAKITEYPKKLSFCSLYRDCDMITNRAVTAAKPVSHLDCRDGATTLVYG